MIALRAMIGSLLKTNVKSPTFQDLFGGNGLNDDDNAFEVALVEKFGHAGEVLIDELLDTRNCVHEESETILRDAGEVLWRIDATLVEQSIDAEVEEICDSVRGTGQGYGMIGFRVCVGGWGGVLRHLRESLDRWREPKLADGTQERGTTFFVSTPLRASDRGEVYCSCAVRGWTLRR